MKEVNAGSVSGDVVPSMQEDLVKDVSVVFCVSGCDTNSTGSVSARSECCVWCQYVLSLIHI